MKSFSKQLSKTYRRVSDLMREINAISATRNEVRNVDLYNSYTCDILSKLSELEMCASDLSHLAKLEQEVERAI